MSQENNAASIFSPRSLTRMQTANRFSAWGSLGKVSGLFYLSSRAKGATSVRLLTGRGLLHTGRCLIPKSKRSYSRTLIRSFIPPTGQIHSFIPWFAFVLRVAMVNSIQEASLQPRAGTHKRKPNATVTASINTGQSWPLSTRRSKATLIYENQAKFPRVWHVYSIGEKP